MARTNRKIIETPKGAVRLRSPVKTDGTAVQELIARCAPLDQNSLYMNLIQCDHFADTCVLAERGDDVLGWISAHVPPGREDTIFVWQVAVDARARGMGLGRHMLTALLERPLCRRVINLETTITRDNEGSWALFRSLARRLDGDLSHAPHFEREAHFGGAHDTEHLVTIALDAEAVRRAA
ncbi:diaminobutyrate acetyltransferase [Rhodobaculum claviforme]|uniref:L-2,4-diaminobutyric acid acetyltransferase n=1 Tax=Rhodobaculum claviforme TaxID=1549854 RepID=A0A934TJB3_9RHOB|nr:diaminobutyrate acetyltransferase [Rhodobaculum claviforme]MBK5927200.1 diaminobutyrate acetyltransferase [Rhodobaculum claviforme]